MSFRSIRPSVANSLSGHQNWWKNWEMLNTFSKRNVHHYLTSEKMCQWTVSVRRTRYSDEVHNWTPKAVLQLFSDPPRPGLGPCRFHHRVVIVVTVTVVVSLRPYTGSDGGPARDDHDYPNQRCQSLASTSTQPSPSDLSAAQPRLINYQDIKN